MTEYKELTEKCGVVGIYGDEEAARSAYFGLFALQHRGQEDSGIASSDGKDIFIHTGGGLVPQVFNEDILDGLHGHIAIGHNRYGTSGEAGETHSQPVGNEYLRLGHNGNFPSLGVPREFLTGKGICVSGKNDSELMAEIASYHIRRGATLEDALEVSYPYFTGAFSAVVMSQGKLAAIRDRCGIRPLSFGRLNGGYMVASETCALQTLGAEFIRDIRPGEMVVIDSSGVHSYQLEKGEQRLDLFELVYFARPDSYLLGKSVNEVRRRMGANLAEESYIDADIVIPVPDSGIPSAEGYSMVSGIPFGHGLIKNRYIHRTFIEPTQRLREHQAQMKLIPLPDVIKGQRVVAVDDSIVRGTTSKKLVDILRGAGAREVHLIISSPPVKYPDFFGINTPDQSELIASRMSVEEIRVAIGADSLHYLSYGGLIEATGLPEEVFSTPCFTGKYPLPIYERRQEVFTPV